MDIDLYPYGIHSCSKVHKAWVNVTYLTKVAYVCLFRKIDAHLLIRNCAFITYRGTCWSDSPRYESVLLSLSFSCVAVITNLTPNLQNGQLTVESQPISILSSKQAAWSSHRRHLRRRANIAADVRRRGRSVACRRHWYRGVYPSVHRTADTGDFSLYDAFVHARWRGFRTRVWIAKLR